MHDLQIEGFLRLNQIVGSKTTPAIDLPQILVPHVKLVSQAFFISQFRYASGAGER